MSREGLVVASSAVRVGHFGSCLSAIPAACLVHDYQWVEAFRIHHNRSDQFIEYYIDESVEIPKPAAIGRGISPKPEFYADATAIIENQLPPYIGFENTLRSNCRDDSNFQLDIKTNPCDVIILDNFMDVTARLHSADFSGAGVSKFFLPEHLYDIDRTVFPEMVLGEHIEPLRSAENWLKIALHFRNVNPNSKIFMNCWSHSTSRGNVERYNRIVDFYCHVQKIFDGEGISIIPPLDVPDHETNGPDDWYHMKGHVYKAIAGYIYLETMAGFPMQTKPIQLGRGQQ